MNLPQHSRTSVRSHTVRACLALVAALGALVWSGCGKEVQTNQPYTPADGVNSDFGQVQIRNLMIISGTEGEGFLSATLTAADRDALTTVAGTVSVPGSEPAPLTVTQPNPVAVGPSQTVLLTQRTPITVAAEGLIPGTVAELTLSFSTAGELTIIVPIMDGNEPPYDSVTPGPASATPSG